MANKTYLILKICKARHKVNAETVFEKFNSLRFLFGPSFLSFSSLQQFHYIYLLKIYNKCGVDRGTTTWTLFN